MQLFGTAPGGMQFAKAKLGGVFNMGSTFSRAGEQPRRQSVGQLDGLCAA
jgi:hypothetical protein